MIGQKNLLKKLDGYTINSLPHSILLVGESGSEQNEICDFICDKFNLVKFDFLDSMTTQTKQFIDGLSSTLVPTLCILDLSQMSANQNMLLKFFEEPNQYVYIIILCENESIVLDTILTRSYVFRLDKYSKLDLVNLVRNKDLEETRLTLEIAHTPGQVELANHCNVLELHKECERLRDSLNTMLAYEVLEYSNKINFRDNYDKYDLSLFTKMLKYVIINKYNLYKHVIDFEKHVPFMTKIGKMEGKQCYFDHFMLELWEESKLGY